MEIRLLVKTALLSAVFLYPLTTTPAQEPKNQDGPRETTAEFFKIPTEAGNIIFVIDISDSMMEPASEPKEPEEKGSDVATEKGGHQAKMEQAQFDKDAPEKVRKLKKEADAINVKTRFDAVKKELSKAIYTLDPSVKFTVIYYSTKVNRWKSSFLKATWDNKYSAMDWIKRLDTAKGDEAWTNIFGALQEAFKMAISPKPDKPKPAKKDGTEAEAQQPKETSFSPELVSAIYLLTDGQPNVGPFTSNSPGNLKVPFTFDEQKAIEWVKEESSKKQVKVHTIAVGDRGKRVPNPILIEKIAQMAGGTFRHVKSQ